MRKSILSRILFLVLMTGIMVVASGCHGSKGLDAFEIPQEFDTSRQYEITFWAKNDTNVTQTEIYKKAISDFEKIYPNIKVNLKLYTDYGKIYNDVITNISTNTTPNVCITYPDHIVTYMTGANQVVPLDELMVDEKYGLGGSDINFEAPKKEDIIPKFLDECLVNGKYYGVPYMRSTEACYINKTYVEALGYTIPDELTWDFVWEVSEAAMEQDNNGNYKVNGQDVMIPFIYKSTDNMMIQMLKQQNAGYSTADGEILLFNDDTKDILYEVAKHANTKAFSTFKISSYPANFLNAGQCIFAIDSTAGATWMGTDAPLSDISEDKLVEFETVVRPVPQYDTDNPQMISQGPSICIFNKRDSQEVMASWIFVQYMLTNDVQIAYSQTEGYVPVTDKAQNSAEYQDYLSRRGEDNGLHYGIKLDATKLLIENTENTFVTPVFNGSASLRDGAGQLIENTVKSVRRNQTVNEDYIQKLYEDVKSLYHLDQMGGSITSADKDELGALPVESVVLLASIVCAWILIIMYILHIKMKKK